ncbi:molybdopterin-dependent oxidoreductase [Natrialbaceae archaeon GCM10025810]|uniref:molybdopterin-dependent oxidoreductase n=1 Tax=Halovalidus salilacus TaxID=3075124 RepID=UPI00361C2F68
MTDSTAEPERLADVPLELERPLSIAGTESVELSPSTLEALPRRERRIEVACLSGSRTSHVWCGAAIDDVLERAPIPDRTTHVLVESTDGYRVCVDVETALRGLLAFARDGDPLPDVADHETRFVTADVDGPRTVKDVARLEAATLSPGEDPESYEELLLAE